LAIARSYDFVGVRRDRTFYIQISAYKALGVPEFWHYKNGKLAIFILADGHYIESSISSTFNTLLVIEGISRCLECITELSIGEARKEFRKKVQQWFE
jgi:hypothetical protein